MIKRISSGLFRLGAGRVAALGARADVVVCSKLDTEATLLGNIILLVLEGNGIKTQDRHHAGRHTRRAQGDHRRRDRHLSRVHRQRRLLLQQGRRSRSGRITQKGYEAAKKLDYDANKIVWLTPAPANNTWAIAVRKDVAEPEQARRPCRDFGKWVAGGGKVRAGRLGRVREFGGRAAGLPEDLWLSR